MNTYYLLPCNCGRKIPVQPRQAGETVACTCGASLEVPSLLRLRTLEQAEVAAEPQRPPTAWNAGHSIIFIGAVVIVASIVIGILLYVYGPTDPYANLTPEQMRQAAQALTPLGSWRLWLLLERGGLEQRKRGMEIVYAELQTQHRIYWALLAILFGIGAALAAGGLAMVKLRKKKPRTGRMRDKRSRMKG
jgi:hypothetical protein